ncbi:MAG TPA: hypothetical protein VHE13_15185 [Opitutus sp.]|nr:hypothetical protein [Opitutus sp.]
MKKRIGLLTTQSFGRSLTHYVEVASVAELKAELEKLGARRIALHWRDRIGDGHTEGDIMPLESLTQAHLDWVTTAPKDNLRTIAYDRRAE